MAVLSTLGGGALLMMLAPLALADDTYYAQNTEAALYALPQSNVSYYVDVCETD